MCIPDSESLSEISVSKLEGCHNFFAVKGVVFFAVKGAVKGVVEK